MATSDTILASKREALRRTYRIEQIRNGS